jgi:hypothetical protein
VSDGFPMSFADFLKDERRFLQRGDIILIRRHDSLLSKLIAWGTGSLFSHCALMFLVPGDDADFSNAFILESTTTGVGVANLGTMVHPRTGVCDIAIKRFAAPWFDDAARREVRGRMLNHVHADYDYGTAVRLAFAAVHAWLFGLQEKIARRKLRRRLFARSRRPKQFICGGFIQYGFLDLARAKGRADHEAIFSEALRRNLSEEAILATTPEDLARSPLLEWKFVVRKGRVWETAGHDETMRRLRG